MTTCTMDGAPSALPSDGDRDAWRSDALDYSDGDHDTRRSLADGSSVDTGTLDGALDTPASGGDSGDHDAPRSLMDGSSMAVPWLVPSVPSMLLPLVETLVPGDLTGQCL